MTAVDDIDLQQVLTDRLTTASPDVVGCQLEGTSSAPILP